MIEYFLLKLLAYIVIFAAGMVYGFYLSLKGIDNNIIIIHRKKKSQKADEQKGESK